MSVNGKVSGCHNYMSSAVLATEGQSYPEFMWPSQCPASWLSSRGIHSHLCSWHPCHFLMTTAPWVKWRLDTTLNVLSLSPGWPGGGGRSDPSWHLLLKVSTSWTWKFYFTVRYTMSLLNGNNRFPSNVRYGEASMKWESSEITAMCVWTLWIMRGKASHNEMPGSSIRSTKSNSTFLCKIRGFVKTN